MSGPVTAPFARIGLPMSGANEDSGQSALILQLAGIAGDPESGADRLTAFLRCHTELLSPETVEQLAELAREKVRVDALESLQFAEAALAIGQAIGDEQSQARGMR